MRCLLLFSCCFLLLTSGCISDYMQSVGEDIGETLGSAITDTAMLSLTASAYYIAHDQWPDTVDDLRAFSVREQDKLLWPELDWDTYSATELKETPDGKLKIVYRSTTKDAQVSTVLSAPQKDEFKKNYEIHEGNDP